MNYLELETEEKESRSIVYHVGNQKWEDLRPVSLQTMTTEELNGKREFLLQYMTEDRLRTYFEEINFFVGKITKQHVDLLIKSGFNNWNMEEVYLYTVDLKKVKKSISYIKIKSTPEQAEYDVKHWKGHNENYFKRRKKYLSKQGLGIDINLSEYLKNPLIDKYKEDIDKHVEYNIIHGDKGQYASYIPHIHVNVNEPIKYLNVERIK